MHCNNEFFCAGAALHAEVHAASWHGGSRPFHAGVKSDFCLSDHRGLIPTFAEKLEFRTSGSVGSTSLRLGGTMPSKPCFRSLETRTFKKIFSSSSVKSSAIPLTGGFEPKFPISMALASRPAPGELLAPILNNRPAAPFSASSIDDTPLPLPLPFGVDGSFFLGHLSDLCPVPLQ